MLICKHIKVGYSFSERTFCRCLSSSGPEYIHTCTLPTSLICWPPSSSTGAAALLKGTWDVVMRGEGCFFTFPTQIYLRLKLVYTNLYTRTQTWGIIRHNKWHCKCWDNGRRTKGCTSQSDTRDLLPLTAARLHGLHNTSWITVMLGCCNTLRQGKFLFSIIWIIPTGYETVY